MNIPKLRINSLDAEGVTPRRKLSFRGFSVSVTSVVSAADSVNLATLQWLIRDAAIIRSNNARPYVGEHVITGQLRGTYGADKSRNMRHYAYDTASHANVRRSHELNCASPTHDYNLYINYRLVDGG